MTSIIPEGRGGLRHQMYAFTEQGVAILSSVLRSETAVRVNIEIMRAFVRLRRAAIASAQWHPVSHAQSASPRTSERKTNPARIAAISTNICAMTDLLAAMR